MQKKLYLCFISVYSEINKGKKSCLHNNNNNNNNKIKTMIITTSMMMMMIMMIMMMMTTKVIITIFFRLVTSVGQKKIFCVPMRNRTLDLPKVSVS